MHNQRINFILLFLFQFLTANAQQLKYQIEKYYYGEQSQSSKINSICQDKEGFLWLATFDGLYKFDGYNFTKYQAPYRRKSNSIRCLYNSNDGEIWIGTQTDGLLSFNTNKEKFTSISNLKTNSSNDIGKTIYDIIGNNEGTMWILTNNGLFKINKKSILNIYELPKSVKNTTVLQNKSLAFDSQKKIWVIVNGKLYHIDSKTNKLQSDFEDYFKSNLISIENINNDQICVGSEKNGIYIINTKSKKIINYNRSKYYANFNEANYISCIKLDNSGNIWIGSSYGLYKLNAKTIDNNINENQMLPDANLLVDIAINTIFIDKTGVLWISTQNGELKKISSLSKFFSNYIPNENGKNLTRNPKVNAFIQDKYENIWIGSNEGVSCFQPKNKKYISLPKDWKRLNEVSSFSLAQNGDILIGTWNRNSAFSTYSFKTKQFKHYTFGDEINNTVGSVVEDKQNLYIATFGNGLLKINTNNLITNLLTPNKFIKKDGFENLYFLFKDNQHRIWISYHKKGLGIYNEKSNVLVHLQHNNLSTSLSNDMVHSICEDNKNRIWIGTNNGLNLYEPTNNTFKKYYPESWTNNNKILGLTCDKNGNIWFMQENRIGKLNPENGQFRFFDIQSWLTNCTFQSEAIYSDSKGIIYFGTKNNGFITINPDSILKIQTPPIALCNFLINNNKIKPNELINGRILLTQNVNNTNQINLSYKENVFSIEFAALSYDFAAQNQYAYKLEGFQNDWIYTNASNHIVTFSNLPPGKYSFQVKAANNSGTWNEIGKQLIIKVEAPPWKNWLAYSLYTLLGMILIYSIFYFNKKRMKSLEILRSVKEQAKITNQQKIQFPHNVTEAKTKIVASFLDDKFFEKSYQIIEQHLSDCEFDVDLFCKDMNLSSKIVYRKIKSATGLSTSEFIRCERLKRAAVLIKENKYNVQEISYMVGFATPSYFTKCFKKQYGMLPKDF